jgi:DNA primase
MRRQQTRAALQTLVDRSHERLRSHRPAFAYLTSERGLSIDTIKREKIGVCSPEIAQEFYSALPEEEWATSRSFVVETILDSTRIVVPICDEVGRPVAVASRSYNPKEKGWINTPFKKDAYLYGLDSTKNQIFRRRKAYLFEGYMDKLYLQQCGLKNCVSSMGIVLNELQVGVILKYCDRLCVCFDTDPSSKDGKEGGGQRGLSQLIKMHSGKFELSAIVLPLKDNGKAYDPDEYVMDHGMEAFLSLEKKIKRENEAGFGKSLFY